MVNDFIIQFGDIDVNFALGYSCKQYDGHVIFYKFTDNEMPVAEVTESIRVDRELHVKLFYKSLPLHSGVIMVGITVSHARVCWKTFLFLKVTNKSSNLVKELCEYKLKKTPKVMRFSLLLRFPLPSSSLFQKISSETTTA